MESIKKRAHWVLSFPDIDLPGEVIEWPSKELRVKSVQSFYDGVMVVNIDTPICFRERDIIAMFEGTPWPVPGVHLHSAYPLFTHPGLLPRPMSVLRKLGRKPSKRV